MPPAEPHHPPTFPTDRVLARGHLVREVARRFRVSPAKVRGWIRRGELLALNMADSRSAKRWVVTPEALAAFEQGRQVATPPRPTPRRKKRTTQVDYYPD